MPAGFAGAARDEPREVQFGAALKSEALTVTRRGDLLSAAGSPRILATHPLLLVLSDGKLHIFREKALTLEAVLASACLPVIHHAVSIDGEAYWDGGYSANPPLIPLVSASRASDALIVQIMPTTGAEMPTTSSEITKRMDQITFNSSLLRDLDALAAMRTLSTAEATGSNLSRKLQKLRLHHIAAEAEYPLLSQSSALNLEWPFLLKLRDAGQAAADRWLLGLVDADLSLAAVAEPAPARE